MPIPSFRSPVPRTVRYSRKQALAALCMLAALLPSCASNKEAKTAGNIPGTSATIPGLPPKPKPTAAITPGVPTMVPPSSVTPVVRPSTAAVSTDGIWYNSVSVSGPYIAITFDDGPSPLNTPRLLDILREQGVVATFYCVGQMVAANPQIAQRIVSEGHEIASHSWSHPKMSGMGAESVNSQLQKTHDAIVAATGVAPRTFRPPYGAFSRLQAFDAHAKFGYKTILWDVDPLDWKNRSASLVESRILSATKSGSIILAHDIHKSTVDAMPSTIAKLKAAGYRFVTVSQLIAMGNKAPLSAIEQALELGKLAKLAPPKPTVPPAPFLMPRLAREESAAPQAPDLATLASPYLRVQTKRDNYVMLTPR